MIFLFSVSGGFCLWHTTVCVRIVADFKAQTLQFITTLCTKILTLILVLNLQLFLHFVIAFYSNFADFRRPPKPFLYKNAILDFGLILHCFLSN